MKKKHFKYINTLLIVFLMTLIMAFVGIMRHNGFEGGWFFMFLKTWTAMLPIAYVAAFIIIPQVRKLTERIAVKS